MTVSSKQLAKLRALQALREKEQDGLLREAMAARLQADLDLTQTSKRLAHASQALNAASANGAIDLDTLLLLGTKLTLLDQRRSEQESARDQTEEAEVKAREKWLSMDVQGRFMEQQIHALQHKEQRKAGDEQEQETTSSFNLRQGGVS